MNTRYPAFFAAAAAVLASGCTEPKTLFECKSADETRSASVEWPGFPGRHRAIMSGKTPQGTSVTGSFDLLRGGYLDDLVRQAKKFCDTGILPPEKN